MPEKESPLNIIMALDTIDNFINVVTITNDEELIDLLVYLLFKSLTNMLIPVNNVEKRYLVTRNIPRLSFETKIVDELTSEITGKINVSGNKKPKSVDLIIRYPIIILSTPGEGNKNAQK